MGKTKINSFYFTKEKIYIGGLSLCKQLPTRKQFN